MLSSEKIANSIFYDLTSLQLSTQFFPHNFCSPWCLLQSFLSEDLNKVIVWACLISVVQLTNRSSAIKEDSGHMQFNNLGKITKDYCISTP